MTPKWPVISDDPRVQAHYEEMRENGEGHKFAEMCSLRQGPSLNTDTRFFSGHVSGNQFAGNEKLGRTYKARAEAAGQSTEGKVYLSSLAAYPGDPKAWVNSKADVKRVCEERGWGCQGSVNVKRDESGIEKPKPLQEVLRDAPIIT